LNPPTFAGMLNGLVANVTTAGASAFPYLTGPVPVSSDYGYLALPVSLTNFTPYVQAPTGESIVGVYTKSDGTQELVNTIDGASFLLNTKLLLHGELSWLTKGLYLGMSRNYFTVHVDDLFLASVQWDPIQHRESSTTTARMTAADLDYARDWSAQNHVRFDFGFNADGSGSTDPLTQEVLANKDKFWFWNHTWDHADLTDATQSDIASEIQLNQQ